MADASDVDAAICARLAADAELSALMPDGVWFDIAAPGSERFVLVSLQTHEDDDVFGERAYERFDYLVKAVQLGSSAVDVKAAALRIDELLHDAVDLVVAGYSTMFCRRIERFRFQEYDAASETRWNHRGGDYELWLQPMTAPK
jgi:hypothetical protein